MAKFRRYKKYKSFKGARFPKKQVYPKKVFSLSLTVSEGLSAYDIQAMIPQSFVDECIVAWIHRIKVSGAYGVGLNYSSMSEEDLKA